MLLAAKRNKHSAILTSVVKIALFLSVYFEIVCALCHNGSRSNKGGRYMERIFASPSRYVQGKGVLENGLHHIKDLGQKVLLLTDEDVWKIAGETLFEDLKSADL